MGEQAQEAGHRAADGALGSGTRQPSSGGLPQHRSSSRGVMMTCDWTGRVEAEEGLEAGRRGWGGA